MELRFDDNHDSEHELSDLDNPGFDDNDPWTGWQTECVEGDCDCQERFDEERLGIAGIGVAFRRAGETLGLIPGMLIAAYQDGLLAVNEWVDRQEAQQIRGATGVVGCDNPECPFCEALRPLVTEMRASISPVVNPADIPNPTAEDRARWEAELDTQPYEDDIPTGAVTIDELIGDIDKVLGDYKKTK